jgi:hypothetical protein
MYEWVFLGRMLLTWNVWNFWGTMKVSNQKCMIHYYCFPLFPPPPPPLASDPSDFLTCRQFLAKRIPKNQISQEERSS